MHHVTITLTAYNFGPGTPEAEFNAWATYVDSILGSGREAGTASDTSGLSGDIDVTVETYPFESGPPSDGISGATEEVCQLVKEALDVVSERWCSEPLPKAITLWCSCVGLQAPSNAAGSRFGYGLTKKQASENANHWANQAPYERFRRVTLLDQPTWNCVTESDQRVVEAIVPDLSGPEHEFSSPEQRDLSKRAWKLARDGKTASAVSLYVKEP